MIILDVNEEEDTLLLLCPKTEKEEWYPKADYNLFVREGSTWKVQGPPIRLTNEQLTQMERQSNKNNISERFR